MCGVGALSRADTSSIPDARDLLIDMAYGLEERGFDATGFGWIAKNAWPVFWKDDCPASLCAAHAPLPLEIQTAIAHTRWATQGDPKFSVNNHPVVAPGIVLVHNGVLTNDDQLFRMLECERQGQVDSEAVAALLAYGPNALGEDDPAELLALVEGDAALAWLDGSTPTTLHLARLRSRPMELGWTKRGDLLMASTPRALAAAAHKKFGIVRRRTVAEGTYLRVEGGEIVDERRVALPPVRRSHNWVSTVAQTITPAQVTQTVSLVDQIVDAISSAVAPEPIEIGETGPRRERAIRNTYDFGPGRGKVTTITSPGRTSRSVLSRSADELVDPFDEWENDYTDADDNIVSLYG